MTKALPTAPLGAAILLLSGCAAMSGDAGFDVVAQASRQRTGAETRLLRGAADEQALAALLQERLAQPLTAEAAVQIALLNNRGLQASYWELGIAEADLVQAGRLANPGMTFKHLNGGGEHVIERTLGLNLIQLLTMPLARRIEAQRYQQVSLKLTGEAVALAHQTRLAWIEAVAAQHAADSARAIGVAADASVELARRMQQAGNWSKDDAAREQVARAEFTADLLRARKAAAVSREKLARLLGLTPQQTGWRLPQRLPDLPGAPRTDSDAVAVALRHRLDIRAAEMEVRQTAEALALTRKTRMINVLSLAGVSERSATAPKLGGYEVTLEVPLFDWGTARVARAEASYMQAVNRLAAIVAQAGSEAREGQQDYRLSYDLARHYRDVVLPLRGQIAQEALRRFNAMELSVFELMADARDQSSADSNYIAALKDFWIADANLDMAQGGRGGE